MARECKENELHLDLTSVSCRYDDEKMDYCSEAGFDIVFCGSSIMRIKWVRTNRARFATQSKREEVQRREGIGRKWRGLTFQ